MRPTTGTCSRTRCGAATQRADAEDVVASRSPSRGGGSADKPSAEFELPWLYAIAARVLANQRRSARRLLALRSRLRELPAPAPQPNAASSPKVVAALRELRPEEQEILRLAAWEGLTNAELAVALDCSENAATIRLHRARKRLAEQLAKEEPAAGHSVVGGMNERTRRDDDCWRSEPGAGARSRAARRSRELRRRRVDDPSRRRCRCGCRGTAAAGSCRSRRLRVHGSRPGARSSLGRLGQADVGRCTSATGRDAADRSWTEPISRAQTAIGRRSALRSFCRGHRTRRGPSRSSDGSDGVKCSVVPRSVTLRYAHPCRFADLGSRKALVEAAPIVYSATGSGGRSCLPAQCASARRLSTAASESGNRSRGPIVDLNGDSGRFDRTQRPVRSAAARVRRQRQHGSSISAPATTIRRCRRSRSRSSTARSSARAAALPWPCDHV